MTPTPYAPPQHVSDKEADSTVPYVQGDFLVVGRSTWLPTRCILTNQPTRSKDRHTGRYQWTPAFRLVIIPKRCTLSFCIHQNIWRTQMLYKLAFLAIVGIAIVIVAGLTVGSPGFSLFLWSLLLVPFAWRLIFADPLTIKHAEQGQFWIAGCSREFLDEYKKELQAKRS